MSTDALWLPVTPSIRRISSVFLTGAPPTSEAWWPLLSGWYRVEAGGWGDRLPVALLPLHIPAGLAIARLRLAEVAPRQKRWAPTYPAEVVARLLRANDPELTTLANEVPDVR